jgi:hypothetical protein
MITAHIATDFLDLPVDFTFELTKVSQLFSFDKLRGDYVPSIAFPDTEHNRNILNHPNRFELKRNGLKEYSGFELRLNGYLLLAGTLVIDDQFSGYVRGAIGNLGASQEDKLITDADLPTNQTFNNKTSFNPADDDYCAPLLQNPDFFKDIGTVKQFKYHADKDEPTFEEGLLQHYHRMFSYSINGRTNNIVSIPSDNLSMDGNNVADFPAQKTNVVTPMLYLFPLIERILKTLKFFKSTSEIDANTELMRLVIYNNYNIVNLGTVNELLTGEGGNISLDSENYNNTWWITYCTQSLLTFDYARLLPRITLKELLLSVQNLLNIVFIFDGNRYRIKDREGVITGPCTDVNNYFIDKWILKKKSSSILKFTTTHDSNDYYFATYYQDLTERQGDFGNDVATYADLEAIVNPPVGQLRRVLDQQRIYEFSEVPFVTESGEELNTLRWHFVSVDFQPVKYNPGNTAGDTLEINTTASTVPFSATGQVRQHGKLSLRKNTESGFALRLIFDQANVGKNNSTNYYLNWSYDNNLIATRWVRTAAWLANREAIEGYFRFPVNIYANLDINKKWRTRHGEFIVDRMVTRFSHSGIGETKIEGVKV